MDVFGFQQELTAPLPHGRGCGNRKEKKLYVTCGMSSSGGSPWYDFLLDPVVPWQGKLPRNYEIVPRGDGSGINDLLLIVGQTHGGGWSYPDPWGFGIEGGLGAGYSKALSPLVDFEQLTPRQIDPDTGRMVGSNMLFLHPMAYAVRNFELDRPAPLAHCQRKHIDGWDDCVSPGWHPEGAGWPGIEMDEPTPCTYGLQDLAYFIHRDLRTGMMEENVIAGAPEKFRVALPSVSFLGTKPVYPSTEESIAREMFQPGVFLMVPISGFEFVKKANEELKGRLESLNFKVAVLDY